MKWTDEHKSIRETAAKFVDNEINPYVDQWEAWLPIGQHMD